MIYLWSAASLCTGSSKSIRKSFQKPNNTAAKMPMRKFVRPLLTIGIGLLLALSSAALMTYPASPAIQGNLAGAAFFLQPTKTPKPQDLSVIGSTDGIVIMGFVIALIIIIPILLRRKSWMEPH